MRAIRLCMVTAMALLPCWRAQAAPDLTTFKDVQWESFAYHAPELSLNYPYAWEASKPERPGEVFVAAARARVPNLRVSVLDRPAGLTLESSALTAARQLNAGFTLESERTVDLGGTKARVVIGRWVFPAGDGVPLRTMVVSAFTGDRWVLLLATDGATRDGLAPALERAAMSLRFPRGRAGASPPPATAR